MKKGNTYGQLMRLLKLVKIVAESGEKGVSKSELMSSVYGCDEKANAAVLQMFKRDRKVLKHIYFGDDVDEILKDNEIPDEAAIITMNKQRKYVIRNGLNLMFPMKLNEQEALALISGVRLVPEFLPPLSKAANNLWLRLKNQMSNETLEKCEFLTNATVSAIPIANLFDEKVFNEVLEALHTRKKLIIDKYIKTWPDDLQNCKFEPYVIYLKHHSWYLLGKIEGKQRLLRLDRIREAHILDEMQENPPKREELVELSRDIRLDYNPYEKDTIWNVKLRITGSFVQPCMETEWFPGEKKEYNPEDNSVIYSVKLKGLEAITLWIMRALNCVEVLAPSELRKIIDGRVEEYLRRRKLQQ